MRKIAIVNVVIVAAVAAFAWEGPVDGGRLACDFVADGVVYGINIYENIRIGCFQSFICVNPGNKTVSILHIGQL